MRRTLGKKDRQTEERGQGEGGWFSGCWLQGGLGGWSEHWVKWAGSGGAWGTAGLETVAGGQDSFQGQVLVILPASQEPRRSKERRRWTLRLA